MLSKHEVITHLEKNNVKVQCDACGCKLWTSPSGMDDSDPFSTCELNMQHSKLPTTSAAILACRQCGLIRFFSTDVIEATQE